MRTYIRTLPNLLQQFSLGMRPHKSWTHNYVSTLAGPAMAGPAGPVPVPMLWEQIYISWLKNSLSVEFCEYQWDCLFSPWTNKYSMELKVCFFISFTRNCSYCYIPCLLALHFHLTACRQTWEHATQCSKDCTNIDHCIKVEQLFCKCPCTLIMCTTWGNYYGWL